MKALIYDIEIINAILGKGETKLEGITYCGGWGDQANMGISVIGAYETDTDRYRVFLKDNKEEFFAACERAELLVTYNGIQFDDPVIVACWKEGWKPKVQKFDICAEFKKLSGNRVSLDALCEKNFGVKKSGDGAMAPVLWQRGQFGQVIDYCLHDIRMTKLCYDQVRRAGFLACPKTDKDIFFKEWKRA